MSHQYFACHSGVETQIVWIPPKRMWFETLMNKSQGVFHIFSSPPIADELAQARNTQEGKLSSGTWYKVIIVLLRIGLFAYTCYVILPLLHTCSVEKINFELFS